MGLFGARALARLICRNRFILMTSEVSNGLKPALQTNLFNHHLILIIKFWHKFRQFQERGCQK